MFNKQLFKIFLGAISFITAIFISCKEAPSPQCGTSGNFIMTLKNEKGRVMRDSLKKTYYIHFNTEGGLAYTMKGYACNLPLEFQDEVNVIFDADVFEYKLDSAITKDYFSMNIRSIDYY